MRARFVASLKLHEEFLEPSCCSTDFFKFFRAFYQMGASNQVREHSLQFTRQKGKLLIHYYMQLFKPFLVAIRWHLWSKQRHEDSRRTLTQANIESTSLSNPQHGRALQVWKWKWSLMRGNISTVRLMTTHLLRRSLCHQWRITAPTVASLCHLWLIYLSTRLLCIPRNSMSWMFKEIKHCSNAYGMIKFLIKQLQHFSKSLVC